ncbi:MFS transporter [Pedococcus bigeumensis]|uniref:MFS transporter n=1 Tax=Pedococcus bigeumensis TaxID=433644 RepID=A0A502CPT2_9MICO|nr:MFS transporter [Pedococcus bigeumensis]TPG14908.1 MFS transporter [Pedococcus bigeumensis]
MPTPPTAGRREWTALAVLCLPLLVASMDVSVLFFAVPFIARDLDPSATQMLWIFDIYGFVLAGLLLTMGSIGDRIGRRRLLLIGAATFSAASLVAAYSTSAAMLIGARALLGVGGATLMPSTLALIRNLFHDERDRGKAIAVWSAVMSGGVGLGPVLGGVLLEHFWWGSVFLINVPVMALLLVAGPVLLPEFRATERRPFDLWSAVVSLAAVLPFIYGVKSTATDGWSVLATAMGVCGVVLGAVFVRRQRATAHPMVDPALFRDRRVGGAVVVNVVGMFGVMGNAIVMTQYLQSVLGMSPLRAALWGLAPSVAVGAAAPVAATLSAKLGRARVMASGFAVAATGFMILATVHNGSPLAVVLVGAGVVACGTVAILTLVTDYVLGVAPPERAGAVSGLFETTSEFGGALGIAILGSVLAAGYRSRVDDLLPAGLPGAAHAAAHDSLAGAVVAATQVPGQPGEAILQASRTAYLSGMRVTEIVAAVTMLAMALVTGHLLRGGEPTSLPVPEKELDPHAP